MQPPPEKLGSFFLGAEYDLDSGTRKDDAPIHYDSRDLVTHAVVVGMTGSGKTGLCVGLLEEAALDKVPAIIIDPKGDMTNLLLQFPKLEPSDFAPWINQGDAERKGKTVEEFAETTAEQWRTGLADWGIEAKGIEAESSKVDRIEATRNTVEYTVFTPGSDAGISVNILGSLAAPQLNWDDESEAIRERINGTVAALLGLADVKADPIRSREAVLMASIFEHFWKQNQDLDLTSLILSIQEPPIRQVGVFDMETFYPAKDRFALAMAFNNIIAAPTFQAWLQGEPLDIQNFMYTAEGKPRHSIFYIAHLSDSERMFFVTLLLENMVTWMRRQSGTTSLRALLYFDEIFGYFPPTAEPPSKRPLLTMMKQARAFGVGVVLVTQNPVDLDYKGLSNAGTWLIGKLQAERDMARVTEGLQSALAEAGNTTRTDYVSMIPRLSSRVFLMHNINAERPVVYTTRWAQSYLRGPLTRAQVRELMADRKGKVISGPDSQMQTMPDQVTISGGASTAMGMAAAQNPGDGFESSVSFGAQAGAASAIEPAPVPASTPAPAQPAIPEGYMATPPIVGNLSQVYLPVSMGASQASAKLNEGSLVQVTPSRVYLAYQPRALGLATISYLDRKRDVDHREQRAMLAHLPEGVGRVEWAESENLSISPRDLLRQPERLDGNQGPYFTPLPESANTAAKLKKIEADLDDWLYYNARTTLKSHEALGVTQRMGESEQSFAQRIDLAGRERRDAELDKMEDTYEKKIASVNTKLSKEQKDLADAEATVSAKRMDQVTSLGESVLNFFIGRKSSTIVSSAMRKQNQAAAAVREVAESKADIVELTAQKTALEAELGSEVAAITERWDQLKSQITSVEIAPRRTDVSIETLAVAWAPTWVVEYDDNGWTKTVKVPAYPTAE